MNNRIAALLKHLSLSSSAFAENIGVQRSSISHVLSGRNKPSLEFVQKIIATYPEISIDWLITGNGTIIKDLSSNTYESLEPISSDKAVFPTETKDVADVFSTKNFKKEIPDVKKTPKSAIKIEKLILVYSDKTFEEIYPKD